MIFEKNEICFFLKDNEYGWLSNFFYSPIMIGGKEYKTVEHYYQSRKTDNEEMREWIRNAPKPFLAMRAGRSLRPTDGFRDDWEDIKEFVMLTGLRAKFKQNEILRTKLLNTGSVILHEDNPFDKYWGMNGKDRLGKLLMIVREQLRENENG